MPTTEILCLANSWKHGGRCGAGLRTDGTSWVRPVSAETEGALQSQHYSLAWGRKAALLDVLAVPLLCPHPGPHHPEDWLIDKGRWKRCRPVPAGNVLTFLNQSLTAGPKLLGNTSAKIAYSSFQRHPAAESLALIRPETLSWHVRRSPAGGKPKIRAAFVFSGMTYNLPVTDPVYQQRLAGLPDGIHAWEDPGQEPLLTISLGEPFGKNLDCYKLVAAVIALPPSDRKRKLWHIFWDWTSGQAALKRF